MWSTYRGTREVKACTLGFLAALFLASAVIAAPDSYYDDWLLCVDSCGEAAADCVNTCTNEFDEMHNTPLNVDFPQDSDLDLDGIPDEYEAWLLQKFAPRIFLHSNENRWPVTVEWLLGRSTLRYSHDGCSDCSILPYGSVNASNITEHFHQNKHSPFYYLPWKACSHKGTSNSSASYTGGTNDTFFLQYDDGAHNGNRWGPWALYGHAYSKNGYIVLQYWQLYAFNDSFASANHEGDWEFTAVAINSEEVPQSVAFYRHGRVEVYAPDEVQWVGMHHVTYSAKGSHGQYANRVSSGDCDGTRFTDRAQGFADSCDTGFAWDSWDPRFGPIVNIGEKFAPINGANWLRYSGKWGEIGGASDFVKWTSGPPGPAYRDAKHWSWAPSEAPVPPEPCRFGGFGATISCTIPGKEEPDRISCFRENNPTVAACEACVSNVIASCARQGAVEEDIFVSHPCQCSGAVF